LGEVSFAVLVVVVSGLVIWATSAAARAAKTHRQRLQRAWQEFAAARGLVWYAAEGSWRRGLPERIKGRFDGVDLAIDTYTETSTDADGNSTSTTYTRVTARAEDPRPVKASIYPTHGLSGLGKLLGFQDVDVGDARFDDAFVVKADDERVVRALLEAPARTALLEFPKHLHLRYDRGAVVLSWSGHESDPRVLDAALAVVIAMCGRPEAGYR
jgi:hypothetical protein